MIAHAITQATHETLQAIAHQRHMQKMKKYRTPATEIMQGKKCKYGFTVASFHHSCAQKPIPHTDSHHERIQMQPSMSPPVSPTRRAIDAQNWCVPTADPRIGAGKVVEELIFTITFWEIRRRKNNPSHAAFWERQQ